MLTLRRFVLAAVAAAFSAIGPCSCGGSTSLAESQGSGTDSGPTIHGGKSDDSSSPVSNDGAAPSDASGAIDSSVADEPSPTFGLHDLCAGVQGLTGQSVLDNLKPMYSATFTYRGTGVSTALSIATRYDGGTVTCHSADNSFAAMPTWVEVQVQIDFVTADSAFHDTFATGVSFAGFGPPGTLRFDGFVPAGAIKGTYRPTLTGFATVNVAFAGTLSVATTNGTVMQQGMIGNQGQVESVGTWN